MISLNFLRKDTAIAWRNLAIVVFAASSASVAQTRVTTPHACKVESGPAVPTIIELYTSEGCNSCPPADQWLSRLVASAAPNVIPLAFHVDYWDYIGWKDEYAKVAHGARHRALVRASGATTVYTPQVFVNGRDDRSWHRVAVPNKSSIARAKVSAEATWVANTVSLRGVVSDATEPLRVRYALTEHGISTVVKAGENKGETLKHDAVVREHAVMSVDAKGRFTAESKVASTLRRDRTQLHVIAETPSGEAVAAVTLKCDR